MYTVKHEVTIVTNAAGAATAYTPVVNGQVLSIQYVKPGSGGYESTVDFIFAGEKTGMGILSVSDVSASAFWYPRAQVHDSAGSALTYDGSNKVCEPVAISDERIKITIMQGGNTKSGTFHITVG